MRNFITHLVNSYIAVDTRRRKADIRKQLPDGARQGYYQSLKPSAVISPTAWPKWRIALGMTREDFWSEAMDFYDPE